MREFFEISKPIFDEDGRIEHNLLNALNPEDIAERINDYFLWARSNKKTLTLEKVFLVLGVNAAMWKAWTKHEDIAALTRWTEAVLEEEMV